MSQRECAGFNWPELSISAEQPVSVSPEAVRRTGGPLASHATRPRSPLLATLPSLWSLVVGVGQPVSATIWDNGTPVSCGRGGSDPREPS